MIWLIAFGTLLVITGFILLAASHARTRGEYVGGGAVVMIGPIPIVLGTDKRSTIVVMVIAAILTLIGFFITHSFRG
ncbi:MAG: hypothetical protein AEth_00014 [Candidatus Argoarchaeum ethanivorans]|uniref:DUF131 domain-containing protein n=1 Tax=Candidatus Argoarchaeum ethanivorans TaxID=2608793 RepID=A0A8B3S6R8_9EURY|nr:MAG: hypothetical protein AEth_00014 [Candidatus Argoarchaeum ethanivorans]